MISWTLPRRLSDGALAALAFALAVIQALPLRADAGADAGDTVGPASLKRMSVEELMQQDVVSVSRRPETWATAPSNVFLISNRAAAAIGATSLPEVLRLAPNLFVGQASAYSWGVEARGFMRTNGASNKLLVLVDGRSVYSPLFSNVFWDTTDVFLPDLDTIEVISGPSGANWGSNAVNGVININSKSAFDTIGGIAEVAGGTSGGQVGWREGVKLGAHGALRVYGKYVERESTLSHTGADDDYDSGHSLQSGFRADWGAADTGLLTVQGDAQRTRNDAMPLPPVRTDGADLVAKYSRQFSGDRSFWVRGYYDYVMRNTNTLLTETTRTFDLEFQHQLPVGDRQTLLWGGNFRRILDHAYDTVGFFINPPRLWYNVASAFAQDEIALAQDRVRLTLGARIEHNDFSEWEFQPNVRLAWRGSRQTAWLAVSRASRIPSRIDTGFYAPQTPPYIVTGGPDFTSEKLTAYELGWRGQPAPGLAVTATVYYHDYDDLRTVEPVMPAVERNGGRGRSYGTEMFVDYDVNAKWRLRAGGFLMNQQNWLIAESHDTEGGRGEGNFPDYQAYLRSVYRFTPDTDLWLGLRAVGEVPEFENGGGVIPAYRELDACFRWRFHPGYELSLVGRNLLDRSHPEIDGQNVRREIPRSVYAMLRYEY